MQLFKLLYINCTCFFSHQGEAQINADNTGVPLLTQERCDPQRDVGNDMDSVGLNDDVMLEGEPLHERQPQSPEGINHEFNLVSFTTYMLLLLFNLSNSGSLVHMLFEE